MGPRYSTIKAVCAALAPMIAAALLAGSACGSITPQQISNLTPNTAPPCPNGAVSSTGYPCEVG